MIRSDLCLQYRISLSFCGVQYSPNNPVIALGEEFIEPAQLGTDIGVLARS